MSDVIDGTIGRLHQQLRAERKAPCLACTSCGGFALLLRDGLCAFCYDDKVYREGSK